MTSTEIRDRRLTMRYRGLLVKQMVQRKNRISGLLMEAGCEPQQAAAEQGGLLRRVDVGQRRDRLCQAALEVEPGDD